MKTYKFIVEGIVKEMVDMLKKACDDEGLVYDIEQEKVKKK